jgi:hypothetical protein
LRQALGKIPVLAPGIETGIVLLIYKLRHIFCSFTAALKTNTSEATAPTAICATGTAKPTKACIWAKPQIEQISKVKMLKI